MKCGQPGGNRYEGRIEDMGRYRKDLARRRLLGKAAGPKFEPGSDLGVFDIVIGRPGVERKNI